MKDKKGVYPYEFPNAENLNYIGEVPEAKYWNKKEDREEYIRKEGDIFNLKEYTMKYCMLDSKLVHDIAKIHLNQSAGTIKEKKYDTRFCPTAAGVSIKIM